MFELVFDFVRNRLGLAVVQGRGDQKEIGQARVDGIKFKNAGVFAFLVFTGSCGGLYQDAGLLVGLRCRHAANALSMAHRRPSLRQRQVTDGGQPVLAVKTVGGDVLAYRVGKQLVPARQAT